MATDFFPQRPDGSVPYRIVYRESAMYSDGSSFTDCDVHRALLPIQDFSKPWTDEELYKKYGLTNEEIAFIESMIKPMELDKEK